MPDARLWFPRLCDGPRLPISNSAAEPCESAILAPSTRRRVAVSRRRAISKIGGYAAPYDLEEGIGYATNIPLDRLQLLNWDELIDIEDLPNEVVDATAYEEPADVY